MAFTQADVDRLKKALASSTQEVWFKGRREIFRSVLDLERALSLAESEVARTANTIAIRRVVIQQVDE